MAWLVKRENLNFTKFYIFFSAIIVIGTFLSHGERTAFEQSVLGALLSSFESESIAAHLALAAFRAIVLSPPFLVLGAWYTNHRLNLMHRAHYPEDFPIESPRKLYAKEFAHHFLWIWTTFFAGQIILRFYFAKEPSLLEKTANSTLLEFIGYSNSFLALLVSQLTIGSLFIVAVLAAYERWARRREDVAENRRVQTGETSYSYRLGRRLAKWLARK